MAATFDLQETIDLLVPLFDPVVKDIQDIKKNTADMAEQLESAKESVQNPIETDSTDSAPAVESSVETQSEATGSLQAVETDKPQEEQEETVEGDTNQPPYEELIYQELQQQNEHLTELIDNQLDASNANVIALVAIIITVVFTTAVKTWFEQATKW